MTVGNTWSLIWDPDSYRTKQVDILGRKTNRTAVVGPGVKSRTGAILRLHDQDIPGVVIAKRLGCSEANVSQTIKRYRLEDPVVRVEFTTARGEVIPIDYASEAAASEATGHLRCYPDRYTKIEILHLDGVRENIPMLDKDDR